MKPACFSWIFGPSCCGWKSTWITAMWETAMKSCDRLTGRQTLLPAGQTLTKQSTTMQFFLWSQAQDGPQKSQFVQRERERNESTFPQMVSLYPTNRGEKKRLKSNQTVHINCRKGGSLKRYAGLSDPDVCPRVWLCFI